MTWVWRLETSDGTALSAPTSPAHPSQADAEGWLGESWRELAADGVAQVTLLHDGTVEYGPMPLSES
jgi:hypothetical protein